jgi:3-hydroxybutyryl-CoA dehydrogenase
VGGLEREGDMSIKSVFIVGSGLMGSGIAQVCAQSGLDAVLYDVDMQALKRALKNIEWSVGKFVEKGELKEKNGIIMGRIKTATDFSEAGKCGLIIEAVFENLDLKKEIFEKADAVAGPETLIASNTSSIPITEIAVATRRPGRVLGLHFFSPVPMMKAVEVIRGQSTTDETMLQGKQFAIRIGKEPIMVNRDVAGFVINRINFPSTMEAMRLVEEGVTTVEDIDKGLRLASGRRMGIFETSDMVGLDVTYGALMSMYRETGDPRWFPPTILRRKVKSGELGRKTGKGWYRYNDEGKMK